MQPIELVDGSDKTITVSASSQRVLVAEGDGSVQVRVVNLGTATVWFRSGDVTVTATTSNTPVGAGIHEVLTFQIPKGGKLYIAAIAAGSTGDITFTLGRGV